MVRKTLKKRADVLLVERGLAETREKAQALIMEGVVYTRGGKVMKSGQPTEIDADLEVKGRLPYVGRGGVKLAQALDHFGLDVSGLVVLDVGASTGGFTDCLLQRGARQVIALDVGHGQLDYRLRQDPRVVVIEGVNARYPFETPSVSDLATIDVAFISVTKVISTVVEHLKQGGLLVVMVKPQFEAQRKEVGKGGVIKDPLVHASVLARVIRWVVESGFRLRGMVPSPILGDAGNREFFILVRK